MITALFIFSITYLGIIFTRLPKINIDRPSAAFLGAVAMIAFGALSFDEAIAAVDFNTIALLLGMMLVITTLELDGFFVFIAEKTIAFSHNQNRLLIIITFISGIASAFLVNDAVVLLFTPVIIKICRSSQLNPIPFLIAEIFASNIGSAMTITGNPQNMLIGIASKISYGQFILYLAPISILGLVLVVLVVRFFYPATFKQNRQIKFHAHENQYQFSSMKFSVPIFLVIIILFFFKQNLEPVHPVDRVDWRSIGPDFR